MQASLIVDAGSVCVIHGTSETRDRFGTALAAGDVDGDGRAELAIGIPGEDDTTSDQGKVVVLAGTSGGLSPTTRCDRFSPSPIVEGRLGNALGVGCFVSDGVADLVVAIPSCLAPGSWRLGATRVFDGGRAVCQRLGALPGRVCSGAVRQAVESHTEPCPRAASTPVGRLRTARPLASSPGQSCQERLRGR